MGKIRNSAARKVAFAASAAMLAVALPSSVFAVGMLSDSGALGAGSQFAFTPASADPDIAEMIAQSSGGQTRMMRFTPAGAASSGAERSVTVAVRVDQEMAQALAASTSIASGRDTGLVSGLRLAPTRYNLGIARGYGSFANTSLAAAPRSAAASAPALSRSLSEANIPDLATFEPRSRAQQDDSRFAARVELDRSPPVAARDARESLGDQMLDVGGSYSLTRNLDITAGVRYEQDRDIVPLPDVDQQDSQAVYVGTQFRF
ncbi:MAG: hypothetical protein JY451_06580 [Erythrobacter sp.]|nr:MAG: hypothetical protein JY451_06580 [Erythrobacter sp.]